MRPELDTGQDPDARGGSEAQPESGTELGPGAEQASGGQHSSGHQRTSGSQSGSAVRSVPEHTDAMASGLSALAHRARIWRRRGLIVSLRVLRLVRTGLNKVFPGIRYLLYSLQRRWRRSL
ncbi:MAG: two-component sensor histidine kinase, partial [Actinomycetota bacterium]|nr:two-component sensor histidine kinase [Actinomycetota bacterium]